MKYTILIASIMLTACSPDPNGLRYHRDAVADIIARAEYDAQQTDNTPVNHAEEVR